MLQYLFDRIASVFPTILGVTLASFVLLVVAPPPSAGTGDTSGEEWRRSLFLDLPLFLNTAPDDVATSVDRAFAAVGRGEEPNAIGQRLASRGAALIPLIVPRLASLGPSAQSMAVAALEPLLTLFVDEENAPVDRVEFWSEVYEARRLDFRPGHVRRLVSRLEGGRSHHAASQLRLLGTYALDELFAELGRRGTTPSVRERIVRLLAEIVPSARPARLEATNRDAPVAWREWWFVHRTDYVQLSRIERWVAALSETRYGRWIVRLTTFRLGVSWRDGVPITAKLAARIPVTLTLTALATLLAALMAVPVGVFASTRHRTNVDRWIGIASLVLYSVPTVWFGTVVAQSSAFAHASRGRHVGLSELLATRSSVLVLAVVCLAYPSFVALSRQQRTAMLAVVRSDFVRTARAKGLPERIVILRHALRNAILPVITLASLQLPLLLGSAVVVEEIFQIPGLGLETLDAVRARDVPWLLAVAVLGAVLTIVVVFVSDLVCALVDPRTRRERSVTRGLG